MAIENVQKVITLDVYDHNLTLSTIKTIAFDNDTRYVAAEIRNEGQWLDIGPDSDVRLTIIRPDKVGVSISGEPYPFDYSHSDGSIDPETGQEIIVTDTYYGAYAELTQAAISVAGIIYAQFKITSGSQILRTEIFQISNGRALDVEPDTWAGEYERYDVIATELLERMEAAEAKANQASSDIRGYASRIATAEAKLNDIADINAEDSSLIITTSTPSSQKGLTPSYITDSASGSVAHFTDGADNIPMKSVKVNIAPVQSGSGDPSPDNVRPISGWDSVKVTGHGRNFCKCIVKTIKQNKNGLTATPNGDGSITINGTCTGTLVLYFNLATEGGDGIGTGQGNGMKNLPNGTYRFGALPSGVRLQIYGSNVSNATSADAHFISDSTRGTFTITGAYQYNWVRMSVSVDTVLDNATVYPALYLASDTDGTYEPYNGNTYDISLASAGTVYGGTLDVVSGVLTVDKKMVTIDGSNYALGVLSNVYNNRYCYRNTYLGGIIEKNLPSEITKACCNILKSISRSNATSASSGIFQYHGDNDELRFLFPLEDAYSTPDKIYALGLECCIPLATPLIYQLSATEIKSFLGINNVWSDAGDMDVEYRADTKLYIDKKMGG